MRATTENKQKVFNKIVKHLAQQGFQRAANEFDSCMYRAPDGKMCAAGCLIPDKAYTPKLEARAVTDAISTEPVNPDIRVLMRKALAAAGFSYRGTQMIRFLRACQDAHDGGRAPEDMKDRLRHVAENNGLRAPKALR